MIVDCISDLHGFYPELEGGDLLIVAGDLTANDMYNELVKCDDWLRSQKYKYKKVIVIAGNHDSYLYDGFDNPFFLPFSDYEADSRDKIPFAEYLCDSGTEFVHTWSDENNLLCKQNFKIWGSPWTRRFEGMNPDCMAFTCETEEELAEKFAMIPDDVDILVTHSPPWGVLDLVRRYGPFSHEREENCGSEHLASSLKYVFRPRLHVFGHIHEGYGQKEVFHGCISINASHVNERYEPVNKPIRVIL